MDNNNKITTLENRIAELEALVKYYEEQLRLSKQKQFGSSSEKTQIPEQISFIQTGLFDEAENTADKNQPEPPLEEITYKRKKRVGKREEDLSGLPVETIEYKLPEGSKCDECGNDLHIMSKEIRREVKIVPAQVSVLEHIQYIYSCRNCEENSDHVPIVKVSAPEPIIKGSLASPSAVAHIMVQKYVNAVPLYRQEQDFIRNGINLSRQVMSNWLIRCAEDWLVPVYDYMKLKLLEEDVLHADETVLQVLNEPGKKANTNSYMWLYRSTGTAAPIILYEYQSTRSSSHPERFLKGFCGYLHTDGYQGYHNLPSAITVVGCWAHARRKFDEALKAAPFSARKGSQSEIGLNFCNQLFEFERKFAELPPDERYKKRLSDSLPVAEKLFAWANSFGLLPKSAFRTAVEYLLNQWIYLKNVYLDGRLELSNNRAERSIKPFVIGRKNWLFCNSQKGASASSIIYSIIETAKENDIKPFHYIEFLFKTVPSTKISDIHTLMPWSVAVSGLFKV